SRPPSASKGPAFRLGRRSCRRHRESRPASPSRYVNSVNFGLSRYARRPRPKARAGGQTMKRQAAAEWRGDLKTGKGSLTTDSGVLSQTPYSFSTRFESEKGTNPEELIAAAHAGCFTMALSAELGKAGLTAESL